MRKEVIQIRCSAEEKAMWKRLAEGQRKTVTEIARDALNSMSKLGYTIDGLGNICLPVKCGPTAKEIAADIEAQVLAIDKANRA